MRCPRSKYVLFLWGVLSCVIAAFSSPSVIASEYIANFERIPAIENTPLQVAVWGLTPTVIVCEYAPVTHIQIDKAVDYWKDLRYEFFTTQYKNDPLKKCPNPAPKGYIIVHLITAPIKMEETALAQTHFYVDNTTDEIEWAIIYLRSNVKETVLEHELGHALGFLHFNKINHLMNEKWTQGGWDKNGLENKRR